MNNHLLQINQFNLYLRTPSGMMHALRDLNFYIDRGEIVGLVGESGSGKSLTVQSILRLLPNEMHAATGDLAFAGQNLLSLSEKSMRSIRGNQIAFMAQDPALALNPTLKIGYQLTECLLKQKNSLSKKEVQSLGLKWLEKLHIGNPEQRMRQYPHELSGGMKQRIALAMALIGEPSLLLADEPTTALDVTVQAEILNLLKSLRAGKQLGILLVTHDLGVVANCCDRVLIMRAGQIIESGDVDQIFMHPRHAYTQALLQSKRSLMSVENAIA